MILSDLRENMEENLPYYSASRRGSQEPGSLTSLSMEVWSSVSLIAELLTTIYTSMIYFVTMHMDYADYLVLYPIHCDNKTDTMSDRCCSLLSHGLADKQLCTATLY